MNPKRLRILKEGKQNAGPVVYWMQRDQRVNDNWALYYAQQQALENDVPLLVLFNFVSKFLDATIRQYGFMLKGLEDVERNLNQLNIPFVLTTGNPGLEVPLLLHNINASLLVADFNPIKIVRRWKKQVADEILIPFHEVDAHNIVPCLIASNKMEFAAYTIRPKINRLLNEFMDDLPKLKKMKSFDLKTKKINWRTITKKLDINFNVPEVDWLLPGENAALEILELFINTKLKDYAVKRNDPALDAVSNLSPYLHFGNISAQRVALEVQPFLEYSESIKSFLEELIIRRELSDNFCYFNKKYDSFEGFPNWANETLNKHRKDKREFNYTLKEFENAETHEDLWNTAQTELIRTGKMHGFMRMYWAKKILEWSVSPESALKTAIYLNDKYSLDGRDPNGYTGIAWSIGGVHDRAWTERKIFGKIRYMNYAGCKRKFDVLAYINKYLDK